MTDKEAINAETLNGQSLDTTQNLKEQLYSLMSEVFTEGIHGKIDW